ncbi:MAG: hypothetical protein ABIH72_03290 [archaeon]
MTKYSCKSCNYRFDFQGSTPKKCPYCDMKGTVVKEQTAEEILDEIGKDK